jgi:formylglycine-generating enzyme required for sulfatase activity
MTSRTANGQAKNDIFLSYASDDRDRVRPLVEALSAAGWSVFWDRTIPFGSTWDRVLDAQLKSCRCLLVVWSRNSVASDWVLEEVHSAKDNNLPIIPVLLDVVKLPFGFRRLQAADLSTWDGKPESPFIRDFIQALQNIIQPSSSKSPPKEQVKSPTPSTEPSLLTRPELTLEQIKTVYPRSITNISEIAELFTKAMPGQLITNTLGMTFMIIPVGMFFMGCVIDPRELSQRYHVEVALFRDERPQHQVIISQPFFLQTSPVTQGQWLKVMGNNPSYFKNCGDDCPVEKVSWGDVQEFIKRLNQLEQTQKYKLPTEAEWEYACRAGSVGEFCFGDKVEELRNYAWSLLNSEGKTHPAGQLKPNAWGLYDMHGNVWEWCQDWFSIYEANQIADPKGPDAGEERVLRGGSWYFLPGFARSSFRGHYYPDNRTSDIGFRVARTL